MNHAWNSDNMSLVLAARCSHTDAEGKRKSPDQQFGRLRSSAYEGAQAQGLHDAAGLQRAGVIVVQIQDYLGAPDQERQIGTPHIVACHMNADAALLQLTQDVMPPVAASACQAEMCRVTLHDRSADTTSQDDCFDSHDPHHMPPGSCGSRCPSGKILLTYITKADEAKRRFPTSCSNFDYCNLAVISVLRRLQSTVLLWGRLQLVTALLLACCWHPLHHSAVSKCPFPHCPPPGSAHGIVLEP